MTRKRRTQAPSSAWCGCLAVLFGFGLVGVIASALSHGGGGSGSGATSASSTPTLYATSDTAGPEAPSTPPPPAAAPAPPAPADPCHAGSAAYCVLNPAVTQATIDQTICASGWTRSIRPPVSYTESLKRQQIAAFGLPGGLRDYEEDHRMPLELGGAPSDPLNLSPESPPSPNPKDSDENRLKEAVCSGQLTLRQAQQQLVATWLATYPGYLQ